MTTPPDDPRADEGLVEAMAEAIFGDMSGWLNPSYNWEARDLLDTAQAALTAARSHGGM